MINYDLIVPHRKHSLKESDEIIRQYANVDRSQKKPVVVHNELAEVHRLWIDVCLTEATKRLTKKEEDFLTSVLDQLDRTGSLSEKQAAWLERIYTEKTN